MTTPYVSLNIYGIRIDLAESIGTQGFLHTVPASIFYQGKSGTSSIQFDQGKAKFEGTLDQLCASAQVPLNGITFDQHRDILPVLSHAYALIRVSSSSAPKKD